MKAQISLLVFVLVVTTALDAIAGTLHVDLNSLSPVPPYTSWSTAATNIQDAIDVATDGDLVLVTNGVYETGGRVVGSGPTNRVALTKAITLQSVNGPESTMIKGYQVPGVTNDYGAVRCTYVTNGAVLVGFTLTNGATWAEWEAITQNQGGGVFCESSQSVVSNCVIIGCASSGEGGGAAYGTINNCLISRNVSYYGGGVAWATLNNCRIVDNLAGGSGGAYGTVLNNCLLLRNTANLAGAAAECTMNNCTVVSNTAATLWAGGVWRSTVRNSIVYHNEASNDPNLSSCTVEFSCSTPLPSGVGNFTNEPALIDEFHLNFLSPCRGAGDATYATGVDLDGEPWANPPSVGCDENSGQPTNELNVAIQTPRTYVPRNVPVSFTAVISGPATASRWEFDEGTVVSNTVTVTRTWAVVGEYPVVLRAYSDAYTQGLTATVTVHVLQELIHYVDINSTNPVAPYTNWATAATVIQNASDVAQAGDEILVADGIYRTGGRAVITGVTNRVALTGPIKLRSVDGPAKTIIEGFQVPGTIVGESAVRCAYLANGAVLTGFTLTNGATRPFNIENPVENEYAAGIWCQSASEVVSNCVIVNNKSGGVAGGIYRGTVYDSVISSNSAFFGGGAHSSALNRCIIRGNSAFYGGGGNGGTFANCLVISNSAGNDGGGAINATLTNCTVLANDAAGFFEGGGGVHTCVVFNSIVYANTAPTWSNHYAADANYCCTFPLPTSGTGNFTNTPWFVDSPAGNFRLQTNSPCINSGSNAPGNSDLDLDSRQRLWGGVVDIGAYEFQGAGTGEFLGWLQGFGLPTDGSVDFSDADGDRMNNYSEWRSDTIPTNSLSVLQMVSATNGPAGVNVTWQSVATRNYKLERAASLGIATPFQTVATNIAGVAGLKTYTDFTATNGGPYFYRAGVE